MQRLVSALLLACAIFITPSYQQNPVLVQGLFNQTVSSGGFAYFYAVFNSPFSEEVQSFQNGVLQQSGGSLQISQTTFTRDLSIDPVAPSDAGLYRVVVTVNGQTISTQAYLNVPGATITLQLSDQTVNAGSTVVIEFQLSLVVPTSEITWFRNAAIVTNTARYTISSSGTDQRLTITNVQTTDAGVFTAQYDQQSTAMQLQVVNTVVINGNWGAWHVTIDPSCGITCGSTNAVFQTRSRACNNPPPSNGGVPCPGSVTDTVQKTCVFASCPGSEDGDTSPNIGIIAGAVAGSLLVVAVVVIVYLKRSEKLKCMNDPSTDTSTAMSTIADTAEGRPATGRDQTNHYDDLNTTTRSESREYEVIGDQHYVNT